MDADSPFADRETPAPLAGKLTVHVNYCPLCHHVWKASAAATACVNCNRSGRGGKAVSLVSYLQDTPIT